MIYLRNPITKQVVKSEAFGSFFDNWIKLTEQEITAYLLEEAKKSKKLELERFYISQECWTFKVFTNDANPDVLKGTYASLTRDADFFAKVITASLGKTMTILDDKNQPVQYFLDAIKGQNLNFKINNQNGTAIKKRKLDLENQINIAKDIISINNIDIQKEFISCVEREINLDNFNQFYYYYY